LLNTPVAAFGGKTFYELLGVTGLTPNTEPPTGTKPGGGRVGGVLFNLLLIKPGSVDAGMVAATRRPAKVPAIVAIA